MKFPNKSIYSFVAAISLFMFPLSAHSSSLVPLEAWERANPNWGGDLTEIAYLTTRCGALFGVIAAVFNTVGTTIKDKEIATDNQERATTLGVVGLSLAEKVGWSKENSTQRFKNIFQMYQQAVSSNRLNHNNMLHGFVQGDYKFCVEVEKQVSAGLEKARGQR
jgi:hypothetical protein